MNRKDNISTDAFLLKSINFVNGALKKFLTLAPEALWVFIGQVGTAIAGLLGIKLLTHVLELAEFGKLALANTIITFIGISFFGPLSQGLMRFWAINRDRGNLNVFYAVSNRFAKYISLATLLITILCSLVLSIIKNFENTTFVTLSLVIGIITGLFGVRIGVFTAARLRRRTAILNISNILFRPLIATFLVVLTVASVNIVLVGYLFATVFVLLITERLYSQITSKTPTYHLKSSARTPLIQVLSKEILSYSWPFLVWGIFGWIHASCDRWSLQTFHGPEVVGAFAVVSQLAIYPLIFGSSFLTTLFSPIAFQRAGDLKQQQSVISANKILIAMSYIYIIATVMLIGFFALFHRPLILLISNDRFVELSYLLPGLTTAWGFFYLGQVVSSFGLLANKPQGYIMPKLISAIIAGISTFYLSAKIGPVGVVWGLATAALVYALWCIIKAWKFIKAPFVVKMERI